MLQKPAALTERTRLFSDLPNARKTVRLRSGKLLHYSFGLPTKVGIPFRVTFAPKTRRSYRADAAFSCPPQRSHDCAASVGKTPSFYLRIADQGRHPIQDNLCSKNPPLLQSGRSFFLPYPTLARLCGSGRAEKNPAAKLSGFLGGEGGIRTPGTVTRTAV